MKGSHNKLIDDSFTCQKENGRLQKSVIKKNLCHYCKILFIYMLKFISFEIDIPTGIDVIVICWDIKPFPIPILSIYDRIYGRITSLNVLSCSKYNSDQY